MRRPRRSRLGWVLVLVTTWLAPTGAHAYSTGISSATFGPSGCPGCHSTSGATTASVSFASTPVVGVPVNVTVSVAGPGSHGGFNLQLPGGTLNDPAGIAQWSSTEVSHDTPRAESAGTASWTLSWTPSGTGTYMYTLWGNSVVVNGNAADDSARASAVTGSVTVRLPQGSTCSTGTQCGSGFCTDGRCCNEACSGTCEACSVAAGSQASNGTCGALVAGSGGCCPTGYFWNGSSCDLHDPCLAGVDDCVGIASCTDAFGSDPSYTCTCPNAGYAGDGRTSGTGCTDINECASNPCGVNGTGGEDGFGCTQRAIGSWSSPGYDCACQAGYVSDGTTCTLQNECTAGTDDCVAIAMCMDPSTAVGDFTCTCPAGYLGNGRASGTGCADIDECAMSLDDCHANATCGNTPGSFTCTCNAGYTGDGRTCVDVNECLDPTYTSMCDPNSTCNNLDGSFECVCDAGWTGDGLVACTDVDECAAGTDDCDANATCTNTPGSFTCACDAGWTGDGRTCTDIDECADPSFSGLCSTVATCNNLPGDWECVCGAGFTGDGFSCEDIDECTDGSAACHADASCANTLGSYSCACNDGYRGSGFSCADIDECAEGTGGCAVHERCVNQLGMPNLCECAPGYARDGDTGECVIACGDGARAPGEQCDDGNTAAGDGCSDVCAIEPGWACREPTAGASVCSETCGDGLVDPTEECDDGSANDDTAPDACRTTCDLAACGDGVVDSAEECDEGASNDDGAVDGCRTSCHLPYCGDGVVDTGEVCDPGGGVPGAAVAGTCTTLCAPDAGVDPEDPPELRGGACRAAPGGGSPYGWALGIALALGLLRRRRAPTGRRR